MNDLRQAAQALVDALSETAQWDATDRQVAAVWNLRAALAQPEPKAEPVAYGLFDALGFYATRESDEAARSFCDTYNQRAHDPKKPYTWAPLYAHPPAALAEPGPNAEPHHHGDSESVCWCNDELLAAWRRKLPGVEPTDREMSAFALGVEVGAERPTQAEPLFLLHCGQVDSSGEQDEWETEADSQVRVDSFCSVHPGRTVPLYAHPPAERRPMTEGEARAMWHAWAKDRDTGPTELIRAVERHHGIGGGDDATNRQI